MYFNRQKPCYRPLKTLVLVTLILSSVAVLFYTAGVRINIDNSVAGLLWRVSKAIPQRNGYVVVCLPDWFVARHVLEKHFPGGGRCGGVLPLLKQVVAIENDNIKIDHSGIVVNSVPVAHSRPLPQLRRIANKKGKVPKNKIVIAGQTNDSLDSRYFGFIEVEWIESSVTPLF